MPLDTRHDPPVHNWRPGRNEIREDREGGFTLFELIIVVAIMPLIVGAISVALISVFNNEQQVANGLTASSDEQVASSVFVRDVQGATWITNNLLDVCAATPGTLLLSLSPDDAANTAIQTVVSYTMVANAGSSNTFTILRVTCSGGVSSAITATRSIAHGALTGTAVSLVPGTLDISNWTAASSASTVNLNLSEPTHPGSSTTNSYSVAASPRTTDTPGQTPTGGFQPILPLTLLGPSCPGVTFTGGSGSTTLKLGDGSGTYGTGSYGTTQSQTSCPSPVGGTSPQFQASQPAFYGLSDPFATLSSPTDPDISGLFAGSCTPTTCTSGIYGSNTSSTAYSNGTIANSVTFDPSQGSNAGVVVFTVPVTAEDGDVFDGGTALTNVTYWFQQGLTIADGATVTFGPATYIMGSGGTSGTSCTGSIPGNCVLQMGNHSTIAVPNGSPGLLFYVPPGSSSVSLGPGFSGGFTGALSPYLDIALWDASSGVLSFGQGNGGGGGYSGGGIYDPSGTVSIAGGYTMNALFLAVASMTIQTSNASVTG